MGVVCPEASRERHFALGELCPEVNEVSTCFYVGGFTTPQRRMTEKPMGELCPDVNDLCWWLRMRKTHLSNEKRTLNDSKGKMQGDNSTYMRPVTGYYWGNLYSIGKRIFIDLLACSG